MKASRSGRGLPAVSQAGTSVIAALVFAALLGAVALGINAFQGGSVNTSALPAADATAAQSTSANTVSDATCNDGEDFNYTVAQQTTSTGLFGLGSTQTNPGISAPVVVQTCPTDQDALAQAEKTKGAYIDNHGVWQNLPQTIQLDPNLPLRNAATCSADGQPNPQPVDKDLCKYVKQSNGNTYKLETWNCRVTFSNPYPDIPVGQSCWVKDVPVQGPVNAVNPNEPPGSAGAGASNSGTSPTITENPGLCGNGATNPPKCDACPGGIAGYDDTGEAICYSTSAQTSAASGSGQTSTTNGSGSATPSTSQNNQSQNCTINSLGEPVCSQGAATPPSTSQPACTNGANNPPTCDACPGGKVGYTDTDPPSFYCQTTSISTTASGLPAGTPQGPSNTNKSTGNNTNSSLGGLSSFLKGFNSTFQQPQYQGGLQQNTCSGLSSLFGLCSNTLSCQLSISPNPPQQGMPANLTWTSSGNVYLAQISGVGNVGPSGSYTVYPNGISTYTMTVYGQNNSGQASCSATTNGTQQTGCTGTNSCTSSQTPYGVGTNGQACSQPPAQPDPSQCTNGTWQPVSAGNNGCVSSYQCSSNGQTTGQPSAQLSCSPQVADVGMSVAISYSCSNSTGSTGAGFSTGNQTSGSTSTVITKPPAGTNTANFGLTCTNGSQASGAQCSVQIGQPAIVLVANPQAVPSGQPSSIGWVTSGMQACVISSPQDAAFTATNENNLSVNGVAQTNGITGNAEFDLTCTTLGGQTRIASTTITVAAASSTAQENSETEGSE